MFATERQAEPIIPFRPHSVCGADVGALGGVAFLPRVDLERIKFVTTNHAGLFPQPLPELRIPNYGNLSGRAALLAKRCLAGYWFRVALPLRVTRKRALAALALAVTSLIQILPRQPMPFRAFRRLQSSHAHDDTFFTLTTASENFYTSHMVSWTDESHVVVEGETTPEHLTPTGLLLIGVFFVFAAAIASALAICEGVQ